MTLAEFNALPQEKAEAALFDCCGCARWVTGVATQRPYATVDALLNAADSLWRRLDRKDWLEAFGRHPQIGEMLSTGSESHREWAQSEQAGARAATEDVKARTARGNTSYFEQFGYIYIVCATGKSAEEMLALLEQRLQNDPARELPVAAEQQRQITRLRLEKLLARERSR